MTSFDKIKISYLMAKNSNYQAKRGYLTDSKNEIIQLHLLLKKNKIKPVLIKGAALLYNLYAHTPEQRGAGDLDILISPQDARTAYNLLLQNGYYIDYDDTKRRQHLDLLMEGELQHFPPLCNKTLSIEIHHRLEARFAKEKINVPHILETATLQNGILGEQWIPNMYSDFIILCHHIYRHEVYEHMYDIRAYIDIFEYILNKNIDFDKLKAELRYHTIRYSVAYTLYYANYLYAIIYKTELVSPQVLALFTPCDFEKEKDAIRCRGLFEDVTYGYWDIPYEDRVFLSESEIIQHVALAVYFHLHDKKWHELFEQYNVEPLFREKGKWYI